MGSVQPRIWQTWNKYDWWVLFRFAHDNRTWNMIGGFRTTSFLINRTWNMIGEFLLTLRLTAETWHMIGGWTTERRIWLAGFNQPHVWQTELGIWLVCPTICFIMWTKHNVNLNQMPSGAGCYTFGFLHQGAVLIRITPGGWGWCIPLVLLTWCWPQSTYIGRDETGSVYLPTQLERTLQLYWWG
jgi:hypothetical protein